ncbi:histidine kinase [Streptomyces sp. NBC_00328]|uniref:histidine kinase n=1 Tax=Streptomyces sp. NBC_00328 TaxID=2903646 RepID=UPI002E290935|nr:histidine kinase [Streptomyces sp. NBC_00328]
MRVASPARLKARSRGPRLPDRPRPIGGASPTGIAYTTDAAVNLIAADPERAVETSRGLRADIGDAITEIRRIVYGLRPRALDELGLVDAVRQGIAPLCAADDRALTVTVDAPPGCRRSRRPSKWPRTGWRWRP